MIPAIQSHLSALNEITAEVNAKFGHLTTQQLNWKPSPDTWSIAQVLDHIIVSDTTYYPQFQNLFAGNYRPTWDQKIGFLSRFWGARLIKDTGPVSTSKFKNPAVFNPSQNTIDDTIVQRFGVHQKEMVESFMKMESFDLQATILASPVSGIIAYNLSDLMQILVGHQQRHLAQANRILMSMNKGH